MWTLAAVAVLAVQDPGVATAGRVLDARGEPVANATVTFLSRAIPRAAEAGPEDRQVVTTNERGVYRATLQRGATYSAWARWEGQATDCYEAVEAGEFVELRGVPGTGAFALSLLGTEHWPDWERYTIRACVGTEHLDFAAVTRDGVDDDEQPRFRVPPLPPHTWRGYEVLDERGEVLWAAALKPANDEWKLELPAAKEWDVVAVDEQGAPLAGVDVRWHIRNYWYSTSASLAFMDRFRTPMPVLCTTDAEGKGHIRVPMKDEGELLLISGKPGYRMTLHGLRQGKRFVDGAVVEEGGPEPDAPFRIELKEAPAATIAVPGAEGFLVLGTRVHITMKNGGYGTIMPMVLPLEDGQATLASPLPDGTEIELAEVRLGDATRARLVETFDFAPGLWRLPDPAGLLPPAKPAAPLALDGATLLQVTMPDGRPAARAVVLTAGDSTSVHGDRTDRVGRALLPGGPREHDHVAVIAGGAFAAFDRAAGEAKRTLQLQRLPRLVVQVADGAGAPVAGYGLRVQQLQGADSSDPDWWGMKELLPKQPFAHVGEDGRLELPMPPFACTVLLTGSRGLGDGKQVEWDPERPRPHAVVVDRDG